MNRPGSSPKQIRSDRAAPEDREWLDRLGAEYRREFPGKLALLELRVDALDDGDDPAADRTALRMAVHRLRGSSGTHGLAGASRILGEWEDWLDAHPPGADGDRAATLAASREFLDRLRRSSDGGG